MNSGSSAGKDALSDFIKYERRIELSFEEERFCDMARWTNDDELNSLYNKPVYGIKTIKNGANYTYDLTWEVETRAYNSAYMPIPYDEILRMNKLIQNEGRDKWQ